MIDVKTYWLQILRTDPVSVAADALPVQGFAASHQLVPGEAQVTLDTGAELASEVAIPSLLTQTGHAAVSLNTIVVIMFLMFGFITRYLRVHLLPRIVGAAVQLTGGEHLQILAAGEALCAALAGAGEVSSASLGTGGAVHNLTNNHDLHRVFRIVPY